MISRHLLRRLAPLAFALALAACGQKGALYLPDGDMPQKVERPQPAPDATPDRSNEPRKHIH
jgi:predicted small lipoprotein YifL